MDLDIIYHNYEKINKEYLNYIKQLIENEFKQQSGQEVLDKLVEGKEAFVALMEESNTIEEKEQNGRCVKDVQYAIVEGIFLMNDLYNFYHAKNQDRFRLRVMNYERRERVANLFR